MSERAFRNWMAVFIVVLVWVAMFVLAGCTRYHVVKGAEGTPEYTQVSVWSNREFQAPDLHYSRSPEDGVAFDFGAQSATQAPSVLEMIGAQAIERLMQVYLPRPVEPPQEE